MESQEPRAEFADEREHLHLQIGAEPEPVRRDVKRVTNAIDGN